MARLTRQAVRELDRVAIEEFGVPGIVLMENAGGNVARWLRGQGATGPIAIACGRGNNGGDGFVIARHLDAAGHRVRVLLAAAADASSGDAAVNLGIAQRSGLSITCLADADEDAWRRHLDGAVWIVDALLGTGAGGGPRGTVATAIESINAARSGAAAPRVVAVDLPSGLDADTGAAAGACVRAEATLTFVAEKQGFANPAARACTGAVHVLDIGAPGAVLRRFGVSR
ncbi:MAG: NAD(P)H-hydrate epimerase [Planctomycetaceae bacterium]